MGGDFDTSDLTMVKGHILQMSATLKGDEGLIFKGAAGKANEPAGFFSHTSSYLS